MTRLIDADALLEAVRQYEIKSKTYYALLDLITNAPTVQREVSVFFEDDDKEVLCFEQYKPEHIVVVLDYAKGEYVQVLRPNADGTTSSKMYEVAPVQREGWVSVPIDLLKDITNCFDNVPSRAHVADGVDDNLKRIAQWVNSSDGGYGLYQAVNSYLLPAAPTDKK